MKVYYAHCIAIYDTPQEARDIAEILRIFPSGLTQLVNPNSPDVTAACNQLRDEIDAHNVSARQKGSDVFGAPLRDASSELMNGLFKRLVSESHVVAFRALPDGSIPSGVFKEIEHARFLGIPVIELPSNTLRRALSLSQTRQYLSEVGQR